MVTDSDVTATARAFATLEYKDAVIDVHVWEDDATGALVVTVGQWTTEDDLVEVCEGPLHG